MSKVFAVAVVVLLVGGVAFGAIETQNTGVAASQYNTMSTPWWGHSSAVQGSGQLAIQSSAQQQSGPWWGQNQCAVSGVGQAAIQGGGRGFKTQDQYAEAGTGQVQKLNVWGPDVQTSGMNLYAEQGETMVGSGAQGQLNAAGAKTSQAQGNWFSNQGQTSSGLIVQVQGQGASGGGAVLNQGQSAVVNTNQFQAK